MGYMQRLLNIEKSFNLQKPSFSESEKASKQSEFDIEKSKLTELIRKSEEELKERRVDGRGEKDKEEEGRRRVVLRIEELERLIMETKRSRERAEVC